MGHKHNFKFLLEVGQVLLLVSCDTVWADFFAGSSARRNVYISPTQCNGAALSTGHKGHSHFKGDQMLSQSK